MFNNDVLESAFNDFFYSANLMPLFTNEHRSTPISVTYLDAKSVVNSSGKYHKELQEFANKVNMNMHNKAYERAMFKIIYEPRTFQGFINEVRRIDEYINEMPEKIKHNTWNAVFYNKDLF